MAGNFSGVRPIIRAPQHAHGARIEGQINGRDRQGLGVAAIGAAAAHPVNDVPRPGQLLPQHVLLPRYHVNPSAVQMMGPRPQIAGRAGIRFGAGGPLAAAATA